MGCLKISYYEQERALEVNPIFFTRAVEKNANTPIFCLSSSRYGFNGQEKDNEWSGNGNSYDYGLRMYDPRIGRMRSIDPRTNEYPWQTPYAYHRNNPVNSVDFLGGGDPPDPNEVNLGKEGTKAFKLGGSTMTPFTAEGSTLSGAGKSMDQSGSTEYTINAQFLQSDKKTNQGISYANGQNLGGASQSGWYYMAQDASGNFTFGQGDPSSDSYNAVGGGRPLIIDGLPYGGVNKYTSDAPAGLPTTGDPGVENRKYLTQKSAAYFPNQNNPQMGKTIVAHNPTSNEVMIIVQEHGSHGYSMDALRNYLVKKGFTNALSFDGSDSSLLIKDNSTLIDNSLIKDIYTNSGITFSVPTTP